MSIKKTTKKTETKKEKNTPLKKAATKLEKVVNEDKIKRGITDNPVLKSQASTRKRESVKTIPSETSDAKSDADSDLTSSVFKKTPSIFDEKHGSEEAETKTETLSASQTLAELIAKRQKELEKKEETKETVSVKPHETKTSGVYSKDSFSSSNASLPSEEKTDLPKTASQKIPAVRNYGKNPYVYKPKKSLFSISILLGIAALILVVCGLYFLIVKPSGSKKIASPSKTEITETIMTSSDGGENQTMSEKQTEEITNTKTVTVIEEPSTPAQTPAAVLTPAMNTLEYKIQWQDSMSTISAKQLGDERRWPTIYKMNTDVLPSPDRYTFGTKIRIPTDKNKIENMPKDALSSLIEDYNYTIDRYQKTGVHGEAKKLSATRDYIKSVMDKK